MKKLLSILSIIMILLLAAMSFTACSSGLGGDADKDKDNTEVSEETADDDEDEDFEEEEFMDDDATGIDYEEEDDEVEIERVKTDVSKFYGDWTAKSDHARFFYGNVDLTVNANGTWTANITEEDFSGKWYDKGDSLFLENEEFSFSLAFSKSGNLIMIETSEDDPEDEIDTVLTRK